MRINTNIAALNTYNQYTANNNAASKSMEKLSSGQRINSAADDAAGLAISEKMRSQIRGLSQSSQNAQDGISLVQTAEGSLDETEQILQRMRELSVQASNDTYTDTDKQSIQSEMDQLTKEVNRISDDTEFNNKKLLNGSLENDTSVGGTNTAKITDANLTNDGLSTGVYTVSSSSVSTTYAAGTVNETGFSGVTKSASTTDANITPGEYTINLASTGTTNEYTVTMTDKDGNKVDSKTATLNNASAAATVDIGGVTLSWATTDTVAEGDSVLDVKTNATFSVADASGKVLDTTTTTGNQTGKVDVGGIELSFNDTLAAGTDTKVNVINNAVQLQIGANASQTMSVSISKMNSETLGIDKLDVTTDTGAASAITAIDSAVSKVSSERAKLGAVENRLDHTINNLTTADENVTAAESRIRDVDVAKEMMNYTTKNVLQQTAQAMLAQANQLPQSVLSLLK